jgi:hypothetical protein
MTATEVALRYLVLIATPFALWATIILLMYLSHLSNKRP